MQFCQIIFLLACLRCVTVSNYQSDTYETSHVKWISLTVILPPMSVLTIAMADPNFSAMIHMDQNPIDVTTSKVLLVGGVCP